MANKKEIEVKLNIGNSDFFYELKSQLEACCTAVETNHQHDIYFTPFENNYMEEKYPYKWLRIRYIDGGMAEICFKHFYPEGAEKHTYCDESQTIVQEPEVLKIIINEMGFYAFADVDKNRTTYLYDRYLVSFDEVKNLGNYIEIEVKDVVFDEKKERKLLNKVVDDLGLSAFSIDYRGYPFQIYKQNHKENNDSLNGIKYILWDWNGTIVDDFHYNLDLINRLLQERGLPTINEEQYKKAFGFPIIDFYRKVGFDCSDTAYKELVDEYQKEYESGICSIPLADGVVEVMQRFKSQGFKEFIFSSSIKETIEKQLDLYPEIVPLINGIIAQDNNRAAGKLKTAVEWGNKNDVNWKEAMIIDDTTYGLDLAKKLGCKCILVNSGHQIIKKDIGVPVLDSVGDLLSL